MAVTAALALAPAASADTTPVFTLQSKGIWNAAQPLIGGSVYTPPVVEGGWSAFAPIDDHTYWTVSDRGPNGQPTVGGATRRTFLTPGFTPTIYKVADRRQRLAERPAAHPDAPQGGRGRPGRAPRDRRSRRTRSPASRRSRPSRRPRRPACPADAGAYKQTAARDEIPYAADGVTLIGTDPYGIDSESIAVDPRDGSFWIGDEYRPSLVHVAADGTVLNRIIPAGVTVPGRRRRRRQPPRACSRARSPTASRTAAWRAAR